MSKSKFYYSDSSELKKGDSVLINGKHTACVEAILVPGTKEASQYSCEEGGFLLIFDNGDVQVWPNTDEDITLVKRVDKTDKTGRC